MGGVLCEHRQGPNGGVEVVALHIDRHYRSACRIDSEDVVHPLLVFAAILDLDLIPRCLKHRFLLWLPQHTIGEDLSWRVAMTGGGLCQVRDIIFWRNEAVPRQGTVHAARPKGRGGRDAPLSAQEPRRLLGSGDTALVAASAAADSGREVAVLERTELRFPLGYIFRTARPTNSRASNAS